jgi:hypothetical protein
MGFGKKEYMRRIFILVLAIATLMTVSVSIAVASPPDHAARPEKAAKPDKPTKPERGPAEKVDVCHYSSGEKGFHLINVSGNALEAHLAHGDTQPGEVVPDMENYEYGTDCEIRSTQVVDGSFLTDGLSVGFVAYVSFDQAVSGTGTYVSYTGEGNIMSMTVSDVCLDELNGVATVWGAAESSQWDDGYLVLTLADDGVSMSTRAVFYEDESDAAALFASQCSTPEIPVTDGAGSLIFGPAPE